ncbi:MAG TPA: hypothetical protein VGI43_03210 [Mucilaginibacter sp.]|jgi:hypothetical protein
MRNQVAEQLHDLSALSFPTIFRGIGVIVTIHGGDGHYKVYIDNDYAAQVEFESDFRYWFVSEGDLHDPDLIKEIGERIEAKLY